MNNNMGFSSNYYPAFKLHDIGYWEWQWWGIRWHLTHDEVERAIGEIEAEKDYMSVNAQKIDEFYGNLIEGIHQSTNSERDRMDVRFVSGAIEGFLGLISNFSQSHESTYDYLKSKIQSADLGNGVIVDLNAQYSPNLGSAIAINSGKIYSR